GARPPGAVPGDAGGVRGLLGFAGLATSSVFLAGCSTEEASVHARCEIREIARACHVEGNERFVSVSRTSAPVSCLAGAIADRINVSIPYQSLRAIGDAGTVSAETVTG